MIETKLGLGGYVTNIRFIDKDGNSFRPKELNNDDPIYNRIVDAGLDMPASHKWADCFMVGSVGTGTSGTSDSMTTLEAYSSHSNTYPYSSVLNGNEIDMDSTTKSIKLFRTFTISANSSGSSIFISEIGVGNENTSNPAIFARILLPTPIEWEDGLKFQFTYNLRLNMPSNVNTSIDTDIQVWDGTQFSIVSGQSMITGNDTDGARTMGVGYIDQTGYGSSGNFFDPSFDVYCGVSNRTSLTNTYSDLSSTSSNTDTYIDGSYSITRNFIFNSDFQAGETMRSIMIGDGSYYKDVGVGFIPNYARSAGWVFVADSAFTKQIGRKFTVTQTLSWDRA